MSDTPRGPVRVLAVLGMHRSGTSWLAGSLEQLGVALGEVSTADPWNEKGNREHPALMALHDGVLRDNDGSWKHPPRDRRWSPERCAELAEFIAGMHAVHALWGFKDPRALLLLDEWRRQVPQLDRVGIFRHPGAVHRSLSARSARFDEKRSFKLWAHYNACLVAEHRRSPFPLLRFDVAPAPLGAGLRAAAAALHLEGAGAETFFESTLVHADTAQEPIPRVCRKAFRYLDAHTLPA